MKIIQKEVVLKKCPRGFHLITDELYTKIPEIKTFKTALANIFIKHTSASLSINENADFSVRVDMENFFNEVADDRIYYTHTYEGKDDMPAHVKHTLIGSSLNIPIANGRFNLGTWQGVYLCEHRDVATTRYLVVTITGE